MITIKEIQDIENILNNKVKDTILLSNSFGINCIKTITENNKLFIVKYYRQKSNKFNAIKSEGLNLNYFNNINLNFFPKVKANNELYLIMSFIENNSIKPQITNDDFVDAVVKIHSIQSKKFGFNFDTQIGGLRQPNKINNNWIEFYSEQRLYYIFDLICKKNSMDKKINLKIELVLKNIKNFIPTSPKVSLLHGDLWEGNILFNDKSFVGFIDPGSFYGHNEMEVAYLRWFNPVFIDETFLDKYNEKISIDKNYLFYEPIYQLYYSLLNVYLWDRSYIKDVERLINKIKI